MKKFILLLILVAGLFACQSEVTKESALSRLQSKSTYNCYFYAPLHIGRVVLAGDNHKEPKKYIEEKYGKLIDKGLIVVEVKGSNSWRTVIEVSLTEAGAKMCDSRRSDEEHAFVAVCKVKPIAIDTVIMHSKDSVECRYTVEQQDVTDFGEFLGYQNGKRYNIKDKI